MGAYLTDAEFLTWIRDRLVHVYGESPNVDFVHRLNAIIEAQPEAALNRP
jgi:hypothetical protein